MDSFATMLDLHWPVLVMIGLQFCSAAMSLLVKTSLNHGMSVHVLVVYRMAVASAILAPIAFIVERKLRLKMTFSTFAKIMLLSLFEPVAAQNLYYTGMKYTTATFTTAMSNLLPALTFAIACIVRYEKINMRKLHCQAKVIGTIVAICGAMVLGLVKGKHINPPWSHHHDVDSQKHATDNGSFVEGSIMILVGCVIWASYYILQAFILKSYPAKLSLATLQCTMGMVQGIIVASIAEKGNTSAWSIHKDVRLATCLYGGLYAGGLYYLTAIVTNKKGPVFSSVFYPLSMVIVAIVGSTFLHEQMYLGRILGAIIIVMGMYMVIWGKAKDEHLQSDTDQTAAAAPDLEENTDNPTLESGEHQIKEEIQTETTHTIQTQVELVV
ncbi:WAT1-related protein [Tripterygium wilfordii]|uniref:WAT1-related protein n=1 Tax=Tripterygium wilfordii TaxID=458696 RepID=A0A7J7D8I7_TRIWF|nr:WAT1-related protein At2g39510-like [Tripterygium wilfordii]KAF5742657.1 WAT1-related protein [Tripterygium wilfordii]